LFLKEQIKDIIIKEKAVKEVDAERATHCRSVKILFRNGELNLLLPGSGCPLQAGSTPGSRTTAVAGAQNLQPPAACARARAILGARVRAPTKIVMRPGGGGKPALRTVRRLVVRRAPAPAQGAPEAPAEAPKAAPKAAVTDPALSMMMNCF
jgi:hypothetical protein